MSDSTSNGTGLKLQSPLQGWCAGLEDNPDPAFSGRLLGDGVSIDPLLGELRAPMDAEVVGLPDSRHAVTLRSSQGAEVLIHVGIDTVALAGNGFEACVSVGDQVRVGQVLLRFDLDSLVRSAPSLRTPVLLLDSEQFSIKSVRETGPVSFEDTLFEIVQTEQEGHGESAASMENGPAVARVLRTGLEHGIHARPAAALADAAKACQAGVFLKKADSIADARSVVAMMGIGVVHGDEITVEARGSDAQAALATIVELLEPMPEGAQPDPASQQNSSVDVSRARPRPRAPRAGDVLTAQAASPGLASGPAFRLESEHNVADTPAESPQREKEKLNEALERIRTYLKEQSSGSTTSAEIALAHLALLDDPLLVQEAEDSIAAGAAAGLAWQRATDQAVATLQKVEDPRLRERTDDLADINLRVQRVLAGGEPGASLDVPEGCVLLADNLLPSQLLDLDRDQVRAVCLAEGGATSHVAILAISMQLPMLVAAGDALLLIEDNTQLLVDAELGELEVDPEGDRRDRFDQRAEALQERKQNDRASASEPCVTKDGTRIHVEANLASATDAREAVKAGAEGCGLLRTEFLFMGRPAAPGRDEQLSVYSEISAALGERPLVVRTLDAGGDKPIAYLNQQVEENPALGVRGIRLSLEREGLLESQLDALLMLDHPVPLQVMIPMVSSVSEIQAVRAKLEERTKVLGRDNAIQLGIMIETPAAAVIADRLAPLVDFFSIGTNDLTQYTLCMDRGEARLAPRLDVLHPAVLTLIRRTVQAADDAGIPVAVCGGAAGDLLAAPVLLGLGVRHLSMPASLIPTQKARLREWNMSECQALAGEVLMLSSAQAVRAKVRATVLAPRAEREGLS